MKKIIISLFSLCLIFTFSKPVLAQENAENKNVKSIMIDPNGKVHIEYYDEKIIPEAGTQSSTSSVAKSIVPGLIRANPVYTSSLSCVNNQTWLWAQSQSTIAIDYMEVYCIGYYSGGGKVGDELTKTPSGWTVSAQSASVYTPESPLPLKIASGRSNHYYKCTGYQTVQHEKYYNS